MSPREKSSTKDMDTPPWVGGTPLGPREIGFGFKVVPGNKPYVPAPQPALGHSPAPGGCAMELSGTDSRRSPSARSWAAASLPPGCARQGGRCGHSWRPPPRTPSSSHCTNCRDHFYLTIVPVQCHEAIVELCTHRCALQTSIKRRVPHVLAIFAKLL